MKDPFASAPDEAQAPPEPTPTPPAPVVVEAPKPKAVKASSGEGKVVLTFKGGSGFDSPWIVIHAEDMQDAYDQVTGDNASLLAKLMDRAHSAGKHFASLGGGAPAAPAGGGQRQSSAPPASQEAPGGEKRFCEHGEMRFRSGVSKTGKPYKAFFCGSGDRNSECKAQFLR